MIRGEKDTGAYAGVGAVGANMTYWTDKYTLIRLHCIHYDKDLRRLWD